jgi:2-oxoglutarate ferredoxin oxidoreductase subunit beta
MNGHPMLKYLKETGEFGDRMPTIFCPGCGAGQTLNYTLNAVDQLIEEDHIDQKDFVFISGIGCSGRMTSHYLQFDSIWSIHGRAPAIATGARLARPELKLIIFTGDGDCAAIGGNHFIHTCRRNLNLTFICVNNSIYGMTGGQVSPTTPFGQTTTTTPYGNIEPSIDLCELARTAGATYIARWTTAHPRQFIRAVKKGIRKNGTAFIEILAQCPTHAKKAPVELLKGLKRTTVPVRKGKVPKSVCEGKTVIGEFVDTEKPEWLDAYQKIIEIFQKRAREETDAQPIY